LAPVNLAAPDELSLSAGAPAHPSAIPSTSAGGIADVVDLRKAPLDAMSPAARWTCRRLLRHFGHQVIGVHGAGHVAPGNGPFILALNHSQKREALLIPAVLAALRGGRQVHFMADWNFLLIPVVAFIIRCNDPIIVNRKSARPRILNIFRPLLTRRESVPDQARRRLRAGRSVGVFPEGTVNCDPLRLLRGLPGVAQLSLEEGIPVVPAGVRFPGHPTDRPISEQAKLEIHFGTALSPGDETNAGLKATREWHARIMTAIAGLSGKSWSPSNPKRKHAG
jgi:1-acyl-sn-glycerol-3-phosphate acyltransferase